MFTPSLPRQRAQESGEEFGGPGSDPQHGKQEGEEAAEAQQQEQQVEVGEQGSGGPAPEQLTDEVVRSRLLTISQAPGRADAGKGGERAQASGDETDVFRRNLMSVSYLEAAEEA